MNRQTLHQQLKNRLENLVERHHELMQHAASIPQQDMNDLLRELRISYELALTLHHQNAMQSMEDMDALVGKRFQQAVPAVEEKRPEDAFLSPAPTPEKLEELSQEARQLAEDRHRSIQASDINHRFEAPQTVAGKFRGGSTVAESIAGKNPTSRISESLHHKPVTDLRKAIGINERFLFTQFLFANDPESFNAAVDRLNNCPSWSEAKHYLDNELVPRYGWDPSQGTVHQFLELVERRYSA